MERHPPRLVGGAAARVAGLSISSSLNVFLTQADPWHPQRVPPLAQDWLKDYPDLGLPALLEGRTVHQADDLPGRAVWLGWELNRRIEAMMMDHIYALDHPYGDTWTQEPFLLGMPCQRRTTLQGHQDWSPADRWVQRALTDGCQPAPEAMPLLDQPESVHVPRLLPDHGLAERWRAWQHARRQWAMDQALPSAPLLARNRL